MPPLSKNKREKGGLGSLANWHPDFRQVDRLPDVKVVRTAFFINAFAGCMALSMVAWFVNQEYTIHDTSSKIRDLNTRITANKSASDQALGVDQKFLDEQKKINEVEKFVRARFPISQLITRLGNNLPPSVILDTVEVQETGVAIRGTITGSAELATGEASSYLELLRKDAWFNSLFQTFTPNRLDRNAESNKLIFDFTLKYRDKPPGSKP